VTKVLDFESVDKGTPLDGLSIPALTRVTLARFAGAVDDYNPMHLDDKVAAAAGKSSVFASSHLIMGYVGRMVEACFQGAALRRYGLRMLKLVWPGDVLTCRGVVIDKRKENGECVIDADVWADNQRGETVAKGRVLAVVPKTKGRPLSKSEASTGIIYPVVKAPPPARVAKTRR
jgi:acyl dehydratase